MRKIKYVYSLAFLLFFLIGACTDLSDVEKDIRELQQEVTGLKEAVALLQAASESGKKIQSVEPLSEDGNGGWKLVFSDGTVVSIANGTDGSDGVTPLLKIDDEGYWCVSYDNGETYTRLLDTDGHPVQASGADGLSVRVVVNEDGYYTYETYYSSNPEVVVETLVSPYTSDAGCIIASITTDGNAVTLRMADGSVFVFNLDVTYPTGIVVLTERVLLKSGAMASFEFRVNPSNAVLGTDVSGGDCQIELDRVGTATRSDESTYVTSPENYRLVRIEPCTDGQGDVKQGQYTAYIEDAGLSDNYCDRVCLVLTTQDGKDDRVQLSSEPFEVVSDAASFLSFGLVTSGGYELIEPLGICGTDISFCLPREADVSSLIASFTTTGAEVYVGYVKQESGKTANDFSSPVTYRVVSESGDEQTYEVSVYRFDLPAVYIATPDRAEIVSKEEWMGDTKMLIWDTDGTVADYGGMNIRGRGNSTWKYPKKPYAIKLGSKQEVLGMPKHKRWVLLANYMDRTLLRNAVAFEIARKTVHLEWTPSGRFVEVILNGQHQGNYYLCEQIKVDGNRLDITEMESTDVEGEALTGGYLLELDTNYDEANKFRSAIRDFPVNVKAPDEDVLMPEQLAYIQDYFNETERLLCEEDVTLGAYNDYLDIDTFIDWWFVHELTENGEPTHPKSSYMYKDRGGKLKAGPVWDFDWGTFVPGITSYYAKYAIWYDRLFLDPAFVARVKEKWSESKAAFESIPAFIEEQAEVVRYSDEANQSLWPISLTTNGDESLSFDAAIARMSQAYRLRLSWMDRIVAGL